jgi:signal transduction histidine kinase
MSGMNEHLELNAPAVRQNVTHEAASADTLHDGDMKTLMVLGQIPGLFWTTDQQLRLTGINGAGLNRFPSDLLGKHVAELVHADTPGSPALIAHAAALAGRASVFEFSHKGRTYQGNAEPLFDCRGQQKGTISIAIDITERKRMDEEKRDKEARAAETRKIQSLTNLAGGVAHSFNNLLTAIMGYTSLTSMNLPSESPLRTFLQGIESAAQCAADLAWQMLVFAQRTKLQAQNLQLNRLIDFINSQTSITSQATVTLDLAGDLPEMRGDPDQLQQLIRVLLINAIEAVGDSPGTVTLKTKTVCVDRAYLAENFPGENLETGWYVLFQVSDTGCGMEDDVRMRIFEPFFSTKFLGRGLGLAAALGIIKAHHGAISVQSQRGVGSVFKILLPCRFPARTGEFLAANPA